MPGQGAPRPNRETGKSIADGILDELQGALGGGYQRGPQLQPIPIPVDPYPQPQPGWGQYGGNQGGYGGYGSYRA